MNNKEIDAAARGCKKYLNKVRIKSFASLKELKIIVNCFINNNFEPSQRNKTIQSPRWGILWKFKLFLLLFWRIIKGD